LARLVWVCLLVWGSAVNAVVHAAEALLWITSDVTTAARSATVQQEAQRAGLAFVHLSYPLAGAATPTPEQTHALTRALAQAGLVWVDAPHASVVQRLQRQVGEPLATFAARAPGRVVWVTPVATAMSLATPAETPSAVARMAAFIQPGGARNLHHAVALAQAVLRGQPLPNLPAPQQWPVRGIYHPDVPGLLPDAAALLRWCRAQPQRDCTRPAVAVMVHRHHLVDGSTAWLDAWLRLFEREGLWAYAVFGQQTTPQSLAEVLELPALPATNAGTGAPRQPHPALLVLHQFTPQAAAMQPLLARWRVPMLATQPFRSGDQAAWEGAAHGLSTSDVPFYLAQPEAAGATDPVVTTAQGPTPGEHWLIERQALAVVAKARRLVALQTRPVAQQRLVAMVYNYPPGGKHFGASFLNVPRSLEEVSQGLADAGYSTRRVPENDWIDGLQPLLAAYYPSADLLGLLRSGQAAAWPVARYLERWQALPEAVRTRMLAHWGPPERSRYVVQWQGEPVFVVPRMQVGQLSVLPQPPREETLHNGQNPFMHKSKVPLSHHYLAVYQWAQDSADALIHFGTHGTQEWANGKSRGLDVHDDALLPLGDLPVVYPYIVDNLGEALTAKRRGRALLVSHRTPTFAPAGFEARMAQMHEVMHEWETVDEGPTRRALEKQLVAQFVEHQLHRDLGWSAERIAADFTGFLELLHPYLDQLAQSSQPKGLAVFGRVPTPEQRSQTILQALRKPLIDALGEDIDEAFLIRHDSVATSRPARWLAVALKDAQAASTLDLRPALAEPAAGPVRAEDHVPNRAARQPIDTPALLKLALRAQELERLLATEGEMPGLLAALRGRFVPAAYGGDPIRNPESLPTGRNLTGLDPSRLPTRQAYEVAQTLFNDWFKDHTARHGGQPPERMALSLWAGETLRHQGILEAQALVALGVRPVWDDTGRPIRVDTLSPAELGRPRVDVLLSVTGSYRDQFPALMALLDQAVAQVAAAEPGNTVARLTRQVATELRQRGVPGPQADTLARVRAFGNAVGDYGTGLADAVQADGLQSEDQRLGQLFLQRMGQPYLAGEPVEGLGPGVAVQAFSAHLRRTDAAVLSRSSHLYAMVSSDDPFQYLGGLSAAARVAGRPQGLELHVSQLQDVGEAYTETARLAIAREMQSRYLHPGWLQAQKAEGYAGTLQVLKAVQFAWGWQSVSPDTVRSDHWQSFHDVLVRDKHNLGLPEWLRSHPQAYAQALERLVQAQRLGHWQADAATRQQLARLYQELTRQDPLPNELPGVRAWVAQQISPALSGPHATLTGSVTAPATAQATPAMPPVAAPVATPVPMGVLLQRQPDRPPTPEPLWQRLERALAGALMLLVAAAGALWQSRRASGPSRFTPRGV
jgi:cobaltochelatase CobN